MGRPEDLYEEFKVHHNSNFENLVIAITDSRKNGTSVPVGLKYQKYGQDKTILYHVQAEGKNYKISIGAKKEPVETFVFLGTGKTEELDIFSLLHNITESAVKLRIAVEAN